MPIDHARLTELFSEAMDLSEADQLQLIARVRAEDRALGDELAAMLDADEKIVTALRTAGLKPDDASAGLRMKTLPFQMIEIPGYKIRGLLGKGGMGVVYAGEQLDPPRPVAIKVLHMTAAEAIDRFVAEAAIMISLEHPGIVRVLASGKASGHPYFVMERVGGVTLDAWIRSTPALRDRLGLFAAVCDAVHYAHGQGVIHRDLKPSNIMVRAEGGCAIYDFGIARAAGSSRTQQGDFLGTLTYMSPEQALGRADQIDARTDVYSLGILLFELVGGGLPYDLRDLNTAQGVRVIVGKPPRALGSGNADLDAIAARALAKPREQRHASAAALADEIRKVVA